MKMTSKMKTTSKVKMTSKMRKNPKCYQLSKPEIEFDLIKEIQVIIKGRGGGEGNILEGRKKF